MRLARCRRLTEQAEQLRSVFDEQIDDAAKARDLNLHLIESCFERSINGV
jgi:hypothetical protein